MRRLTVAPPLGGMVSSTALHLIIWVRAASVPDRQGIAMAAVRAIDC